MRFFNLLNDSFPPGIGAEGLGQRETAAGEVWRWAMEECTLHLAPHPHGLQLRFRVFQPESFPAQTISFFLGEKRLLQLTLARGESTQEGKILLPPNNLLPLRILSGRNEAPLLPADEKRPLAFCFSRLEILDGKIAAAKICPMPFTRLEVNGTGRFVPCCAPWLTPEFHALPLSHDAWNGIQAQKLREKILFGDYSYCHTDQCQTRLMSWDEIEAGGDSEFIFSPANAAAAAQAQVEMPEGPTAATILSDPRCNLACPSCRSEKITRLNQEQEGVLQASQRQLSSLRPHLRRIRLAGDGEALFSPFLRQLIRDLSHFPALEIAELHTNGLLLDEKAFGELLPGSRKINRVMVSVDGGNEATYQKVRGGDWNRLLRNLQWLGKERAQKRLDHLGLLFVYRAENLSSMEEFVKLARFVGADSVHFSPLTAWSRMAVDFVAEAVHLPAHARHQEFLALRRELRASPGVTIS